MKKCTGENCPMQIGYDVENCAAIEKCPYRTWPVTRLRETKFGSEPVTLRRPPQSWCYVKEG